jgi:hypothetical protein
MRLLLVTLLCVRAFAAVSATTQFNVRQDGSDTNGGGFDPTVGSPGTNESLAASGTSMTVVVGATTTQGTATPAFSATTHGPGNLMQITSGSGCTTGVFLELSQSGGTATFDRSLGSAASVCTATIGGGYATIAEALTQVGNSGQQHQVVWVCGTCGTGTFSISTVLSVSSEINLIGYSSTHGDITPACIVATTCTRPTVESNTASVNMFQPSGYCWIVNGLNIVAQTSFTQYAFLLGDSACLTLINTRVAGNGASNTVAIDAYHSQVTIVLQNSEIYNWNYGIASSSNNSSANTVTAIGSYIHGNTYGLTDADQQGSGSPYTWVSINSVWDSNGYGWYMQVNNAGLNSQMIAVNSVFSNSTHDGINSQSAFAANGDLNIYGTSIFWGNGGYGVNVPFSGGCLPEVGNYGQTAYNNGVGNNTSGNYNCVTSVGDVSLSSTSPFFNSSSGNFALTTAAKTSLGAAGFPGAAPFGTGYAAIGALQPAAGASGPTAFVSVQ